MINFLLTCITIVAFFLALATVAGFIVTLALIIYYWRNYGG